MTTQEALEIFECMQNLTYSQLLSYLCKKPERIRQAAKLGADAKWVQKVGFGLVCAHIHGCITDSEYDRILQKFQKKILVKRLKRLSESEG